MSALRDLPPLAWFLIAFGLALFIQWNQASALGNGDIAALLSVGERSQLRPIIEEELGQVPLVPGSGHDGQMTYVIARHPVPKSQVADLFDHAGYRYRRILYPLLGSGFGTFSPRFTLYGLALLAAAGFGLAATAMRKLADRFGLNVWVMAGIVANPGLWLSLKLMTPDALAFGLALAGTWLWLRRSTWPAVGALALSCLTKEPYLLVVIGLAGWELTRPGRSAARLVGLFVVPLPLVIWSGWLSIQIGDGFAPRGNLGPPLVGLIGSLQAWLASPDPLLALLTMTALVVTIAGALSVRSSLLAWLTWPWLAIALSSSDWVWALGNNAARAFAPLFLLAAIVTDRLRSPAGVIDASGVQPEVEVG